MVKAKKAHRNALLSSDLKNQEKITVTVPMMALGGAEQICVEQYLNIVFKAVLRKYCASYEHSTRRCSHDKIPLTPP